MNREHTLNVLSVDMMCERTRPKWILMFLLSCVKMVIPPLPLLHLADPHYEQGFFIFDFTEYERVRSEGTKQGGNVLLCAEVEGVRYVISWNNFLTKDASHSPIISVA